ncbi:unnamed protein product [Spirodela intermedia]|uniref:Retrotransposon gag domain-containing protein n=1 Tax=Spirodela intermedia TaxID=51605 RepID=A0A7I8IIW5_SPIIN|nr:unnamed protein product [Spirodela intermedia]CAA6657430.1 unnamed protein product [Spirodela intermedia]
MAMKNYYIPDSFQRASNIRVPLAPNVKFRINPRFFQMLPNFHGLPLEEPHQHLEKFHMVCDLVNLPQVTPEIIKMKLFPYTLRDKASHWLSTLDRELTSWKDIEQAFLRKFYPLRKTQNMRKHIWSFSQRPGETLHETWEKFKDLLKKCPHHAIPSGSSIEFFMMDY